MQKPAQNTITISHATLPENALPTSHMNTHPARYITVNATYGPTRSIASPSGTAERTPAIVGSAVTQTTVAAGYCRPVSMVGSQLCMNQNSARSSSELSQSSIVP